MGESEGWATGVWIDRESGDGRLMRKEGCGGEDVKLGWRCSALK